MRYRNTLKHALAAAVTLAACATTPLALGDDAARTGREAQAFGEQLTNDFSFPTESGGSFNFGQGVTISPDDLAPGGEGLYVQDPNLDGVKGVYDSDHDMDVTGRATQGKLYQDAQAMGNPFDTDPALREQAGPSTVSGAAYQIVLGVSDARNKVPDLSNDPIISGSGDAMLDDSLLDSFGDCSVETEVTEGTRPVHIPEEEFCERVMKPAPATCEIKHELVIKSEEVGDNFTVSMYCEQFYTGGSSARRRCSATPPGRPRIVVERVLPLQMIPPYVIAKFNEIYGAGACSYSLASQGTQHYYYNLSCNGKKTVLSILEDRWYPEECIERAKQAL